MERSENYRDVLEKLVDGDVNVIIDNDEFNFVLHIRLPWGQEFFGMASTEEEAVNIACQKAIKAFASGNLNKRQKANTVNLLNKAMILENVFCLNASQAFIESAIYSKMQRALNIYSMLSDKKTSRKQRRDYDKKMKSLIETDLKHSDFISSSKVRIISNKADRIATETQIKSIDNSSAFFNEEYDLFMNEINQPVSRSVRPCILVEFIEGHEEQYPIIEIEEKKYYVKYSI